MVFLLWSLFAVPTDGFLASPQGADARGVHSWAPGPLSRVLTTVTLYTAGKNFDDETRNDNHQKGLSMPIQMGFAVGDELKRLRNDLDILRHNLELAEAMDDRSRIHDLTKAIRDGERGDPEIAYAKALQDIAETKAALDLSKEDKDAILFRLQERAQAARSLLPRFQMEGLWIGK